MEPKYTFKRCCKHIKRDKASYCGVVLFWEMFFLMTSVSHYYAENIQPTLLLNIERKTSLFTFEIKTRDVQEPNKLDEWSSVRRRDFL